MNGLADRCFCHHGEVAIFRRATASANLKVPGPRPRPIVTQNAGVLPLAALLPPPVAWVFAGGGSHGAVQLGSLQAISETDAHADSVMGTSAGALTGAVIAEDPRSAVNRLAYLWQDLDFTDIVRGGWTSLVSPTTFSGVSLASDEGERASLRAVFVARDFSDLVLPFVAIATDAHTGQPTLLHRGDLLEALLASSAVPGVFPPVHRNGRWYIDGLASANLPASIAMRNGAGSILAFDTGSGARKPVGPSVTAVVPAINELLSAQQRVSSLTLAADVVPVVYLPTPTGLAGTLSFRDSIDMARDAYVMGQKFLIDLVAQYGGAQLAPGLYARPDAFGVTQPAVARVLRPVLADVPEPTGLLPEQTAGESLGDAAAWTGALR